MACHQPPNYFDACVSCAECLDAKDPRYVVLWLEICRRYVLVGRPLRCKHENESVVNELDEWGYLSVIDDLESLLVIPRGMSQCNDQLFFCINKGHHER
jgi:hypothetical protein